MTYTCVYFEKTKADAIKRLKFLRKINKSYKEVKSYIIKLENGDYRILQQIEIS